MSFHHAFLENYCNMFYYRGGIIKLIIIEIKNLTVFAVITRIDIYFFVCLFGIVKIKSYT